MCWQATLVLLIKVAEVWVAVGTVVVLQNLFLSCH
jgi:hypothetical protein